MGTNDITNDRLTKGHVSEDYRNGYDAIFGKAREKAVPSCESSCLDTSSEYLARSRAVIRDYWETPEDMWERLDELDAEYKGKD